MCTFFFAQILICNTHIAKYRIASTKCPRREEGKVRGNEERGREEGERRENEEKRGEKILGERFSRARIGAHRCAHSNRNVVFLLSQVSHFGVKRRKN